MSKGLSRGVHSRDGRKSDDGLESDGKSAAETLTWLDPTRLSFRWDGGPGPISVTLAGERCILRVHASQAFPLSHPDQLVQLEAPGDKEPIGMIEDVSALADSDRSALNECLRRGRILPEVTRILSLNEVRQITQWMVETDRGVTSFDMDKVFENVSRQPSGDIVLTDVLKNRYYVVPERLDRTSRAMLERYS